MTAREQIGTLTVGCSMVVGLLSEIIAFIAAFSLAHSFIYGVGIFVVAQAVVAVLSFSTFFIGVLISGKKAKEF